jgi:hypothetical protein
MPAQWTGSIVGEMHINGITGIMLAEELDWHPKYLSQVLNSSNPPKVSQKKIEDALHRLIDRKRQNYPAAEE